MSEWKEWADKCPYCNGKMLIKYKNGIHILKCPNHFLIAEESLAELNMRYSALKNEINRYRKSKKQESK